MVPRKGCDVHCMNVLLENLWELYDTFETAWGKYAYGDVVYPQSYEEERRLRTELELRSQRLTLELADTKQHIQDGDYRRDNYPNIKRCVCVCVCE